jgi:hypothetical protein
MIPVEPPVGFGEEGGDAAHHLVRPALELFRAVPGVDFGDGERFTKAGLHARAAQGEQLSNTCPGAGEADRDDGGAGLKGQEDDPRFTLQKGAGFGTGALRGNAQGDPPAQGIAGHADGAEISNVAVDPDGIGGAQDPVDDREGEVFCGDEGGDVIAHRVAEEEGDIQAAEVVGGDDHRALGGDVLHTEVLGAGEVLHQPAEDVVELRSLHEWLANRVSEISLYNTANGARFHGFRLRKNKAERVKS